MRATTGRASLRTTGRDTMRFSVSFSKAIRHLSGGASGTLSLPRTAGSVDLHVAGSAVVRPSRRSLTRPPQEEDFSLCHLLFPPSYRAPPAPLSHPPELFPNQ